MDVETLQYLRAIFRISLKEIADKFSMRWEMIRVLAILVLIGVPCILFIDNPLLRDNATLLIVGDVMLVMLILLISPIFAILHMPNVAARRDNKQLAIIEQHESQLLNLIFVSSQISYR